MNNIRQSERETQDIEFKEIWAEETTVKKTVGKSIKTPALIVRVLRDTPKMTLNDVLK